MSARRQISRSGRWLRERFGHLRSFDGAPEGSPGGRSGGVRADERASRALREDSANAAAASARNVNAGGGAFFQ